MSRTYDQYAGGASLELVAKRWTLLVARELLLGPALHRPDDRLPHQRQCDSPPPKDSRSKAWSPGDPPPPAASAVYDLTPEPQLVSVLAPWPSGGMTMLGEPRAHDGVRGKWIVLGLASTAPARLADGATYELHIAASAPTSGPRRQLPAAQDRPTTGPGPHHDATALADVSAGRLDVDDALVAGRVTVRGRRGRCPPSPDVLFGAPNGLHDTIRPRCPSLPGPTRSCSPARRRRSRGRSARGRSAAAPSMG